MPRGSTDLRKTQPRCVNTVGGKVCSHPRSFHGVDRGHCRALGCHCPELRLADDVHDEPLRMMEG